MYLTPETIDAYKQLLTDPKKHGFDITPIKDCFVDMESGTPKDVLHKEFIDKINKPVPKVVFYIIMDELYPNYTVKCENGNLGWKLGMIKQTAK